MSETTNPLMTNGTSSNMNRHGLTPGLGVQVGRNAVETTITDVMRRTE